MTRPDRPNDATSRRRVPTPIGALVLCANGEGLTHALFEGHPSLPSASDSAASPHLDAAEAAVHAYLEGASDAFAELALRPRGTPFQQRVWHALRAIPFGATCSYRELAAEAGNPRAARAVGAANHHNPLMVIVPCHRVIAADGSLAGYGGGLDRKRWLLAHEGVVLRDARAA